MLFHSYYYHHHKEILQYPICPKLNVLSMPFQNTKYTINLKMFTQLFTKHTTLRQKNIPIIKINYLLIKIPHERWQTKLSQLATQSRPDR